jgi:hypothetical protein
MARWFGPVRLVRLRLVANQDACSRRQKGKDHPSAWDRIPGDKWREA